MSFEVAATVLVGAAVFAGCSPDGAGIRAEFPIRVAAFSPDGKLLALGTAKGTVEIWDLEKRSKLRSWKAHRGEMQSLVFHPDGTLLASEARDRRIVVSRVENGNDVWSAPDPDGTDPLADPDFDNTHIAFTPDGNSLAAFGFFWDAGSGKQRDRYGPAGAVSIRAGWLSSGSRLGFRLRNLETLSDQWDIEDVGLLRLEVSPDGKLVAAGRSTFDAGALLKRASDGKQLGGFLGKYWISGVAFSPDSRHLALSGYMDAVYVYSTQTMQEELRLDTPGVKNYWVGFSPDGKTLAAVGENEEVRLWSFPAGKPLKK
ncbi:MAG: WD40 repeat domain-containing protein [Planctomycetia bacterium]|nr:WD40 repeat domain-containing protein [Planctomycetia bacterium]